MQLYSVNKFGLFRCVDDREEVPIQHRRWICVIAAVPLRNDDINHYTFEAENDTDAKLIYEVEYGEL